MDDKGNIELADYTEVREERQGESTKKNDGEER